MLTKLNCSIKSFTHIVHVADCHIRLTKRFDEYYEAFDKLYKEIEKTPKTTLIAFLGDLLHSKSDLSPECVQMASKFLSSLANLRPTILISGNHDCYSGDHDILTQNGWVNIKQYIDDASSSKIATFNSVTKEIEFQTPIGVIRKHFDGEMYNFTGKNVDLMVTPTHQMLYYHTQTNKFYKKSAENVPHTGLIPINGIINSYIESPFFKLLGFSFAEGTFVLRSHKINTFENKYDGCRVQFHLKCKREIEYLLSVLKQLNYFTKIRPQKDGSVFIVIYEELAKKICSFFENKREIPESIFNYTNSELKSFVDGYLNGDGHRHKNKKNYWSFSSVSEQSVDILYTISRLIGSSSTKSNRVIFGNYENSKQQYLGHINLNETINNSSIKNIDRIKYNGYVYCVSVPNSNILIRRNGLISICGNCTLSNKNRLDSLTPIVDALNHPNLFYLRDTGLYAIGDILFNNMSVFSDVSEYITYDKVPQIYKNEYVHHIALYHGPVNSALTDLGFYLVNKAMPVEMFDGHHIALLGDIHKKQDLQHFDNLGCKPAVHFVGSFIQQSHGESIDGHGFSLWDLKTKTYTHTNIPNDYGFFTVEVNKGQLVTNLKDIPKKARVRIKCFESVTSEVKSALSEIKKVSLVDEVSYQRIESDDDSSKIKVKTNVNVKDISDVTYQNKLLTNFLKDNCKVVDQSVIDSVLEINTTLNGLVEKDKTPKNLRWKPKKFEFDNMFSYGEGNVIDFSKCKNVMGLFAGNACGKSSIFSGLSFCIFDKFDRGYRAAHVLNVQKTHFRCKFNFEIDGVDFFIEKKGVADRKGNVKVDVKFWKVENGKTTDLNGEARRNTNDIIKDYVGSYEDFVLTSLSLQNGKNVSSFIDMGQSERKDLLAQFIGLTIFDKLLELGTDKSKDIFSAIKSYKKDDFEIQLASNENELESLTSVFNDESFQLESLKSDVNKLNDKLLEETKQLKHVDVTAVDIHSVNKNITDKTSFVSKLRESIPSIKNTLNSTESIVLEIDNKILELDKKDINNIFKLYQKKKTELAHIEQVLELKKVDVGNKVKKLDMLKKHEYDPNCKYCVESIFVKDAEKIALDLENDKTNVKLMLDNRNVTKKELESMEWVVSSQEEYMNLLKQRNNAKDTYNKLSNSLQSVENNISKTNSELESLKKLVDDYDRQIESIRFNDVVQITIGDLKREIKNFNFNIDQKHKKLVETGSRLATLKSSIKQLTDSISKVKELEKQHESYSLYIKAVNRDGLPYSVISSIVPEVEREVNNILSQIVEFHLVIETDGKSVMPYIVYDDKRWPIEMASGFEKFIASLAIRVALINISNLPRPAFLAVDEGWGTMDSDNLSQVKMLLDFLKTNFDFIIIISHLDFVKDCSDQNIEIKKENGFSKIEFS